MLDHTRAQLFENVSSFTVAQVDGTTLEVSVLIDDLSLMCPFGEVTADGTRCSSGSFWMWSDNNFAGPNGIEYKDGFLIVSINPSGLVYFDLSDSSNAGNVAISPAKVGVNGYSGDGIVFAGDDLFVISGESHLQLFSKLNTRVVLYFFEFLHSSVLATV